MREYKYKIVMTWLPDGEPNEEYPELDQYGQPKVLFDRETIQRLPPHVFATSFAMDVGNSYKAGRWWAEDKDAD